MNERSLFRSALDVANAIVRADPDWPRWLVQSLADQLGSDTVGLAGPSSEQSGQTRSETVGGPALSTDATVELALAPIAAALAYRHAADGLARRMDDGDPRAGRATDRPAPGLTPRERQVLALVAGGSTNRQVARHLELTERTVRKHLEDIYRRLDVSNRVAASRWWVESRWSR